MDAPRKALRATVRLYQRISAPIILLLCFLGVLYFLVYFLLNSGMTARAFDETVNTHMLRGRLAWTRLTWGPWPWRLKILEPKLVGADGQPVIVADAIYIGDIDLLGLVQGRIGASAIVIERPVVRLVQRPHPEETDAWGEQDAVFNIEALFWPPERWADDGEPGNPPPLDFRDAEIVGARVLLDLPSFWLSAQGVDVAGARFSLLDGRIRMGAEQFRANRCRLRVPASGDLEVPVGEADRDEVFAWSLRGLNGTYYQWDGKAFGVARLDAQLSGDPLSIRRFHMDLDAPFIPSVRGQVVLEVANVATHLTQFEVEGIEGPVRVEVDVPIAGPLDGLDAQIALKTGAITLDDEWAIDRVTAQISAEGLDRFTASPLVVDAYGGQISGAATFDLVTGNGHLDLTGDEVDPRTLPIALPDEIDHLWQGAARLRLLAGGTDLFGEARGWAHAHVVLRRRLGLGPSYGLARQVDVVAAASLAGDTLTIGGLDLDGGDLQFDVGGTLDLLQGGLALRGRLGVANVTPVLAPFGVRAGGRVNLRYRLSGGLEAPFVTGSVSARAVTYPKAPQSDLDAELTFDVATLVLRLAEAQVRTTAGDATVSGKIDLAAQRISLEGDASQVKLEALPMLATLEIGGRVDAHVRLTGRLRQPRVAGTVTVHEPRYRALRYARLELKGVWAGKAVDLKRLSLVERVDGRDDERLGAMGVYVPSRRHFGGRLDLRQLELSVINKFLPEPIPLRGRVSLTLAGAGPIDDPSGRGTLTLEDVAVGDDLVLGGGEIAIEAEGQMLNLDGRLFRAFHLNGGVPTTRSGPLGRVTVSVQSLQLEDLLPQLTTADVQVALSGHVSALLDLWGDGEPLQAVRMHLTELSAGYSLRDVGERVIRSRHNQACLECPSFGLSALEPVRLTWTDGTLGIESLRLGGDGQTVEVMGNATPSALDLTVEGGLDLAGLWPVLRSVFTEVEGQGRFAFKVTGAPDNPTFDGGLRLISADLIPRSSTIGGELSLLEEVTIRVQPPYGPQMPDARGRMPQGVFTVLVPTTLDGQPNRLRLRRDDETIDVLQMSGWFRDFKPEALLVEIRTDEAELDIPRVLNATVATPGITFELWEEVPEGRRLPETRLRLSGHVDLLRGEYIADITSAAEISEGVRNNFSGRARSRRVSIFERSPVLQNLEVDLSARGDDELYVRNQVTVLDLNLAVAVNLRRLKGFIYPKGDRTLVIDGRVDILEDSQITYARRPFDVTLGEIEFRPEKFLQVDIEANHTFRMRTDRAGQAGTFDRGASGDVREEEVTLKLQMVLDQLGSTPQFDLNFSSSSGASKIEVATLVLTGAYPSDLTGAASATPATEVLLSPVLSLIEAPFEETLNVDLTLTPATTGTLFIDADKILSRRLRLYSRTPVGDDAGNNPQTFGLEYRLNNTLTGELTTERLGNINSTSGRLRLQLLLD